MTKAVFFHIGTPWYLKYTVAQAKHVQVDPSDFCVLGQTEDNALLQATPCDQNACDLWISFERHYVHMSSTPIDIDLVWWRRWFVLLHYMETHDISRIHHLDSDVVLLKQADWFWENFGGASTICTLSVPTQSDDSMRWSVGGHCSLWTLEGLRAFCTFSVQLYAATAYRKLLEKKWSLHQREKRAGGVCDMTGLYLFWRENANRISNNLEPVNGHVVDFNFSTAENGELFFRTRKGRKELLSGPGFTGVTTSVPSEQIEFACLHCQGSGKGHIPRLVRGDLVDCSPWTRLRDNLTAAKLRSLRIGADMVRQIRTARTAG